MTGRAPRRGLLRRILRALAVGVLAAGAMAGGGGCDFLADEGKVARRRWMCSNGIGERDVEKFGHDNYISEDKDRAVREELRLDPYKSYDELADEEFR